MSVLPPEAPGPNPGQPGHYAHHDWLTQSAKALDSAQASLDARLDNVENPPTNSPEWSEVPAGAGFTGGVHWIRRGDMVTLASHVDHTNVPVGWPILVLPPVACPLWTPGLVLIFVGQGLGTVRTMTLDQNGNLATGEAGQPWNCWGTWTYPGVVDP